MPRTKPLAPRNSNPGRRVQLASKSARKSAPSTYWSPPRSSSSEPIDLTVSPSPKTTPSSHMVTTQEPSLVSDDIKHAIASVPAEQLRSAVLKVCAKSSEATRLLGPLLAVSPSAALEKKRKRSVEICYECGEEVDDDGDGCCKFRRMRFYKRREMADELRAIESFDSDGSGEKCSECGEIASTEDDGCCKWRMMQYYRRRELISELEHGI